ncbi:hypothetical protein [Flavobacterium sp. N2270]|uniref:hypothetical protein n=1 Tax=Flavobacterium sp. N2270 TaxID=2986831 RepID=UPI0022242543|nr:hypothetical protein [Flavobacterium sp. N2270]
MLDKYDKQIMFEYLWKTINFFYGIMILLSILVGIRALLYFLGGMKDENFSVNGLLIVSSFIIIYIVLRNLTKPYFMRKINQ